MPYLVDGDNLLGTWPGRRRSDAGRRALAHELSRFSARLKKRILVVFDGGAPPDAHLGPEARFAGPGASADDVIIAFLRAQSDRRGWTLVTSDRALGDACRHLGATVERSDRFRSRLVRDTGTEKPEREADVEYWLELFGDGR